MALFEHSYTRPGIHSASAKMRIIGAVGEMFYRALDHGGYLSDYSKDRLRSAQFFVGGDVVQTVYEEVPYQPVHKASPNFFVHHQKSYDLQEYTDETARFLNSLSSDLREAFEFVFKIASKGKNEFISDKEAEHFKYHMLQIFEAFDLTDQRLKTYEAAHASACNRGTNVSPMLADMTGKRDKIEAKLEFIQASTDEMDVEKARAVRDLGYNLVPYYGQIQNVQTRINHLLSLKGVGERAAKTMLYSRITSRLTDDDDTLRDQLYKELLEAPDVKAKAKVIRALIDKLTRANNLTGRFTAWAQRSYKVLKSGQEDPIANVYSNAEILAQEFETIRADAWIDNEVAIYKQHLKTAEDVLAASLESASQYFVMENGEVAYNSDYAQWRSETLRKLYLSDDLNGNELALANVLAEGLLPERRQAISDKDYFNADYILAKIGLGAERPRAEEIFAALSDKSRALLKDEDFVIYMITSGYFKIPKKNVLRLHRAAMGQAEGPKATAKVHMSPTAEKK